MGYAILTATLLLLIQYGNAANLYITPSPNASLTVQTEDPINLSISYNSTPTLIIWQYGNGILMATWINGTVWIAEDYKNRLILQEKSISISNSATKDSGEYLVTVTSTKGDSGSSKFNVNVIERVLDIQSTDTGIYGTGANISLTLWYDGNPSEIVWFYNGNPLVIKTEHMNYVSDRILGRIVFQENGSLIIYTTTKDDAGNYSINVIATTTIKTTNATTIVSGSRRFQVKFYDPVGNVTVKQSPQVVSENNFVVNLSCSASSGYNESVTWMKDGQSITNNRSYNLLDGNQTLQITQPNRTFSANYSCNISNAVYWNSGLLQLRVYDPVGNVTVKQAPQVVSENTSVDLSCSASSGYNEKVIWMKDGKSITNNSNYNLLDGNQTLHITQPNRTFSGNYSCTISNTVYWNSGSLQVRVYDPVGNVTVKQSPQVVSENTSVVNLSCSASSGYSEAVTWMKDGQSIINNSIYNLLDGNQTLRITQPNRTFSANYSCNISNAVYWNSGSLLLRVYDPVVNVAVTQSPQKVNEGTALVNLSCSASSGYTEMVTWMKDGQSVISKNPYSLLDGNRTLQITRPDRTFNGLYTCNISNTAYWGSWSLGLTISYATLRATSTYSMVIITLLGGILLAH